MAANPKLWRSLGTRQALWQTLLCVFGDGTGSGLGLDLGFGFARSFKAPGSGSSKAGPVRVWARRVASLGSRSVLAWLMIFGAACAPPSERLPGLDRFHLPTAMTLDHSGQWLFVTQGNWDRAADFSVLSPLSMAKIEKAAAHTPAAPVEGCVAGPQGQRVFCEASSVISSSRALYLPSGAANMVLWRAESSPHSQLLVLSRHARALTRVDLRTVANSARPELECGQGSGRWCASKYRLRGLGDEAARIYLDKRGFPFAYIPHLLGRRLSLLWLGAPEGPALVDSDDKFFNDDPRHKSGLGGGFGLAQIPCRPQMDYVPSTSRDCTRPYLYASHRFDFGVRAFAVAPGRKLILHQGSINLSQGATDKAAAVPTMGAMAVDPRPATALLYALQTEPPILLQVDIALDDNKRPKNRVLNAVSTCTRADLMLLVDSEPQRPLAVVSCPADGKVLVFDRVRMRALFSIEVGSGANEMHYDPLRKWLWVANTTENSISVVDLNPLSPRYGQERLVLGHARAKARVMGRGGSTPPTD